jgi:hypothetical protein
MESDTPAGGHAFHFSVLYEELFYRILPDVQVGDVL